MNNAAIAAAKLVETVGGSVTVIDLDAHHGNGTQEIFYERSDVRYASVHIGPAFGYFPHFVGFEDEHGAGAGHAANLNLPLPPGTGDGDWVRAVEDLIDFAAGSNALVVSLGVDAWADDPESPFEVTHAGFNQAGQMIGSTGPPTVIVQEGGYDLAALGSLVMAFLEGLAKTP